MQLAWVSDSGFSLGQIGGHLLVPPLVLFHLYSIVNRWRACLRCESKWENPLMLWNRCRKNTLPDHGTAASAVNRTTLFRRTWCWNHGSMPVHERGNKKQCASLEGDGEKAKKMWKLCCVAMGGAHWAGVVLSSALSCANAQPPFLPSRLFSCKHDGPTSVRTLSLQRSMCTGKRGHWTHMY
jgi:hypothetical protein